MENDRCISSKEVQTIVPFSRSHRDRRERDPKYMGTDPFPSRVQIGACRVCWMLSEVLAWLQRRADRRKPIQISR
jgi:predicted DNA-binding transcriptional regulator AlpA